MGKRAVVLLPQTEEILEQMGAQMKLARLRRKLSVDLVAERAGISRTTLCIINFYLMIENPFKVEYYRKR